MLAENLKKLRESKNLSFEAFGKLFGKSKQTVFGWEKGTQKPDIFTIEKIADHFDISIDKLVSGEDITIKEPPADYGDDIIIQLKAEMWDMRKQLDKLEEQNKNLKDENEKLRVQLLNHLKHLGQSDQINHNKPKS